MNGAYHDCWSVGKISSDGGEIEGCYRGNETFQGPKYKKNVPWRKTDKQTIDSQPPGPRKNTMIDSLLISSNILLIKAQNQVWFIMFSFYDNVNEALNHSKTSFEIIYLNLLRNKSVTSKIPFYDLMKLLLRNCQVDILTGSGDASLLKLNSPDLRSSAQGKLEELRF